MYLVLLYGWHLSPFMEAAVRSDAVHALQHQSFVLGSILVWWPALEPHRRELRGESRHGLTPVADQQLAGALMLSLDFFVVLFALSFFFWRAARAEDAIST